MAKARDFLTGLKGIIIEESASPAEETAFGNFFEGIALFVPETALTVFLCVSVCNFLLLAFGFAKIIAQTGFIVFTCHNL